jgi:hypothetical protein
MECVWYNIVVQYKCTECGCMEEYLHESGELIHAAPPECLKKEDK